MSALGTKNLRVGLIGAGMVGQLHARSINEVDGLELTAVADLRPGLRKLVADSFAIPKQYRCHQELLADADIDVVWVVTRRDATSAVVRDCLSAGKPVFSEKPMAMTLQAAIDLTDTARERSLFYMVGFQKRHDPAMALCRQTLHRLLESSELGRLTLVRVWNHTGQDRERDGTLLMTSEARPDPPVIDPPAPAWLTPSRRASYYRFVNAYCHDINALHFFFDAEPNLRAADLDVMGGQAITLAYPDFIVSMAFTLSELSEWSMRGEWDEGMEFHFEGGRLLIAFPPPLYRNRNSRVTLRRGARSPEILSDGYSSDSTFTIQAKNLLRHLRAEIPSPSSASVCLRDMRLIDRMWRHTAGSEASDTAIQKVPCHG